MLNEICCVVHNALSVLLFIVKYLHTDDMLSSRLPSAHLAMRCVHGPAEMSEKVCNMVMAVFSDILKQKLREPDTDVVSDRYLKYKTCIMLHICKCVSILPFHRMPVLWLPASKQVKVQHCSASKVAQIYKNQKKNNVNTNNCTTGYLICI